MIEQTVTIILIISVFGVFDLLIGFYLLKKMPTPEYTIVIIAQIFQLLTYASYFPLFYLSTPESINQSSISLARLGYFFSTATIVSTTYMILLIDFKFSYQDIFEFLSLSWVAGATIMYNALSTKLELKDGNIYGVYDSVGIGLIILLFCVEGYIWFRRFYEISTVFRQRQRSEQDGWFRKYRFFMILGTILTLLYIYTLFISKYQAEIPFITGCFMSFIGIIVLYYDKAFIFVTDIVLDSVIIIEKRTGIRAYSKVYNNPTYDRNEDADFIGSVVSAINVNFPSTIQSKRDLAEMIFIDKTVLIYSGKNVRSILVVSSTNLITKALSKYLVKKFEKKFGEKIQQSISQGKFIGKESEYESFNEEVDYVRKFLPL